MSGIITGRVTNELESFKHSAHFPQTNRSEYPVGRNRHLQCTDVLQTRARHKMYKSSKEFDLEFGKLFEKARRVHEAGSEAYGRALLLQVKPFCHSASTAALILGITAAVPGYHISESPECSVHIDHEFRISESRPRQCQTRPRL